jgi:hypothetical protein
MKKPTVATSGVWAIAALFALSAFPLAAQTAFKKSKMYVTQEHKMKLRKVELTFTDTALVIQGVDGKYREKRTVPYAEIKKAEYEYSKHRGGGRRGKAYISVKQVELQQDTGRLREFSRNKG